MNDLKSYIEMLIKQQSEKDAEFKALLSKPNKSIEECAKFLQGEAYKEAEKQKGTCRCVGWSDATMTGQIIHYYQEDSIKAQELPSNVTTTPPVAKPKEKTEPTKVIQMPVPPRKKGKAKKESKNPKCQELSLF